MGAQGAGRPAGLPAPVLLPLGQDPEREMLQIHEINDVPVPLRPAAALHEFQGERENGPHRLRGCGHGSQDHVRTLVAQRLAKVPDLRFFRVPHGFDRILARGIDIVVFFAADGRIAAEGPLQGGPDRVPQGRDHFLRACILTAGQLPAQTADLSEQPLLFLLQKVQDRIRPPRLQADLPHGVVGAVRFQEHVRGPQDHGPHPGHGVQGVRIRRLVVGGMVPQPRLRGGMALRPAAQVCDQLLQRRIILPGAEICGTAQKSRVPLRVFFLQEIPEHIRLDEAALGGVDLPKSRVQVDVTEIVAQQKGEKTVHCGDLRIVEQDLLPLQVGIARILPQTRRDRLTDPLPHLCRGRPGKGHNQQPVDVRGVVPLADQAHDALDQDGGLAASGSRRDQNIVIARIQNLLLRGRKVDAHVTPFELYIPGSGDRSRRPPGRGSIRRP